MPGLAKIVALVALLFPFTSAGPCDAGSCAKEPDEVSLIQTKKVLKHGVDLSNQEREDEVAHLEMLAPEAQTLVPSWNTLRKTWKDQGGSHEPDDADVFRLYNAKEGIDPSTLGIKQGTFWNKFYNRIKTRVFAPWVRQQTEIPKKLVMMSVNQGDFAVLWAPEGEGVLYTLGLAPCIGISIRAEVGAEGSGSFAIALAHADETTDQSTAVAKMLEELQKVVNHGSSENCHANSRCLKKPVVTIVGGRDPAGEEKTRAQFDILLKSLETLPSDGKMYEMCTRLRSDVSKAAADALISTKSLPTLLPVGDNMFDLHEALQWVNKLLPYQDYGLPATCSNDITKYLPTGSTPFKDLTSYDCLSQESKNGAEQLAINLGGGAKTLNLPTV